MSTSYAVSWLEEGETTPAVGKLALEGRHALLEGTAAHVPRQTEFDASELEAVELLDSPRARLNSRPTVAISLRGRGRLLIAELFGIGVVCEIVSQLGSW
jgi:hypothetical protein